MGTTKQRRAILAILSAGSGHMTVERVFEEARRMFPNIGKGTVYRNLNHMADEGEIRRLHLAGRPILFDRNAAAHQHVVCVECGAIADIPDIEHEKIRNLTGQSAQVVEYALTISVICESCLAERTKTETA